MRLRWLRRGILVLLALSLLCTAVSAAEFSLTSPFFSGKRVLVLVPHQDDELNLAGGILEQYVQGGSEVFLVYSTNGDYNGLAEERSREVLAVARRLGIPEENILYMGYGDQWNHQEQNGTLRKHLYFSADPDAVWTSHFGASHTYGTAAIGCWASRSYTRANFLEDLLDILLFLRPDVIYCTDYDAHHDHMALDLFFEEAMGILLAREPDYRPTVYKGFCYGTAWYAPADYVGEDNLRSSQRPAWEHWERLGISYSWADRVRLPLSAENTGRLLSQTTVYQCLRLFESQNGRRFAPSVLNGDKVFFERRTDSLLYRAVFSDGTGTQTSWNDFKLKDSEDFSALINTGVRFAPEITVTLPEPLTMDQLWLYDAPSPEDNILGGFLVFDDGTRLEFGPLNPGGDPTKLSFPARTVRSFTLHLTQTEGANPGLTEIEAYHGDPAGSAQPQLLMAADENGDFAYDYRTDRSGRACFSLYAYPAGSLAGWQDVTVTAEGPGSACILENGLLQISCPLGRSVTVTIAHSDQVRTTFTVSNPTLLTRWLQNLAQYLDAQSALLPGG